MPMSIIDRQPTEPNPGILDDLHNKHAVACAGDMPIHCAVANSSARSLWSLLTALLLPYVLAASVHNTLQAN